MVTYFYKWIPLVIVGTVVILSLPPLGLIALIVGSLVAMAALAALAWVIVSVPLMLGRAIRRRRQDLSSVSPRTAAALSPSAALSSAKREKVQLATARAEREERHARL